MSMLEFTGTTGKKIGPMGGAFMFDPNTSAYGESVGLDFFTFYALGRGGVLGSVDAQKVIEAFHFFEPAMVASVWEPGRQKTDPRAAARHYAEASAAWGRARLSEIAGLEAFSKLALRVTQAHEPTPSSALFTGWREMLLPDDAPGRAGIQISLVLRELRGGAHIDAVKEVGLTPLEALVANSPHMVQLFGWTGEVPDAEPLQERAARAEELTDELVAPAFEILDESERETFAGVINDAAAAVGV